MINTMSAEYVLGLDINQAETVYLNIISQLVWEHEEQWDLEAQAHRIMDNCKLYPEFFPELRNKKV